MNKKTVGMFVLMLVTTGLLCGCTQMDDGVNPTDPPRPLIVSQSSRSGMEGLDWVVYIDATIYNQGGDGRITVWASVEQGGNQWSKKQPIYLHNGETSELTFTFREVSFWDSSCYWRVWIGRR